MQPLPVAPIISAWPSGSYCASEFAVPSQLTIAMDLVIALLVFTSLWRPYNSMSTNYIAIICDFALALVIRTEF